MNHIDMCFNELDSLKIVRIIFKTTDGCFIIKRKINYTGVNGYACNGAIPVTHWFWQHNFIIGGSFMVKMEGRFVVVWLWVLITQGFRLPG